MPFHSKNITLSKVDNVWCEKKAKRKGNSQETSTQDHSRNRNRLVLRSQSPKEGVSPLHIFFAIFPIAAAATIVAVKPELQEQVKANWNTNGGKQHDVQETLISQQTAASAGSDVENVS